MTRRAVVTGGGGFVGRFLIKRLLSEGFNVASVARSDYPFLREWGVETHQIDLSEDSDRFATVCAGTSVVFHVAAKVDMWGTYQDFYRANVIATKRVIAACREHAVDSLVYTSSPSVIAGGEDLCGVDESYPYPEKYLGYYPQTKAIAERDVLAANSGHGLKTIVLRPHLIWGPGDMSLIPAILEKARAGRLIRVGSGNNLSDFTFIDDCIDAHLCALRALEHAPASCGKAYFISQGAPVKLWWWIDQILVKAGLCPVRRSIPRFVAESLAWGLETFARVTGSEKEPLLTRFLVKEMATSHYFDISQARKLLGYNPTQTTEQRLASFELA